ncbi:MAG: SOS response-associated peptidase [Lachnospiraceae bacterium]|nr:SOS response-associated peptidase [Lachnospiraceae bacterium]
MCCRFFWDNDTADRLKEELGDHFSIEGYDREHFGMADVHPQDMAHVLLKSDEEKKLALKKMVWGFKALTGKDVLFNARAETADVKPSFSEALAYHRCLVPASGFYEWDARKNKATFRSVDGSILYFCGIYRLDDNADRFTILTTDANVSMAPIHDRMPLFVGKDRIMDWIGRDESYRDILKSVMPELSCTKEYEQMSLFGIQ